jgi:hypothetical protein
MSIYQAFTLLTYIVDGQTGKAFTDNIDFHAPAFDEVRAQTTAVTSIEHPRHPQLAVSAAIFRDGKVLLVRRARSPGKGFYSLPRGPVESRRSPPARSRRWPSARRTTPIAR